MEALLRGREAAAWALIVLVVARSVVLGTALLRGAIDPQTSAGMLEPVAVLALAAVVLWCRFPATRHRRLLAGLAMGGMVTSLVTGVALTAYSATVLSWPETAAAIIAVATEALALGVLVTVTVAGRARRSADVVDQAVRTIGVAPDSTTGESDPDRAPTPAGAPVWDADEAVGTAWFSADAAAQGATGHTETATAHGWVPLGESRRELPGAPDDAPTPPR